MSWGYVTLVTMDKKHTRSFLNEVLSYKDEIEFKIGFTIFINSIIHAIARYQHLAIFHIFVYEMSFLSKKINVIEKTNVYN